MDNAQILIIDFGGQYTRIIGRRLRELRMRPLVLDALQANNWLSSHTPKGIIISGGWTSIYDNNAPALSPRIFERNIPLLGICLGMHWIAQTLGGTVAQAAGRREYGVREFVRADSIDPLFLGVPEKSMVLASHGDSVTMLPPQARMIGSTSDCPIAAFALPAKKIWAVQFHPEVADSVYGRTMLKNFLSLCGAKEDWDSAHIVSAIQKEVKGVLIPHAPYIHLFSGGVDSTVIAAMLKPILGERLKCVALDAGNFRENEADEIHRNANAAGCGLMMIDVKKEFLAGLAGMIDAEEKRLAFQRVYRTVIENIKNSFGAAEVMQGTLATDLIESGAAGQASLIKTHHNVGVASINPLNGLFKDEVREIARFLGLPEQVSERMPFPGPGLFVRIVGTPVTEESVDTVRWADARVREIIRFAGIEKNISQLIVALIGLPTTGVKGDSRSYAHAIVVRAMQSIDFMTGQGYEIPADIRRAITHKITQHPRIVRVWFDETPKPPATFELE